MATHSARIDVPSDSRFGSQSGDAGFTTSHGLIGYTDPREVFAADTVGDVLPVLHAVAREVDRGRHAVGFVAYEAAPAFDAALACHPPTGFPLAWFALYDAPASAEAAGAPSPADPAWSAQVARETYARTVAALRDRIAAGETYQVNYTFPMDSAYSGDPFAWFHALVLRQQAQHCAFINTGRHQIVSLSPELFFRLEDGVLTTRPMKGTRRRGRWPDEDARMAAELAASEKDRAENVMIVDLLRNDMGRISEPGSVAVTSLFDVERYPTVWQMTSTIESRTRASVPEIFRALFPSGSVTGAPKVQTMKIVRDVEPHPRGVYCGAVGRWLPGGFAEFNVAIRTLTVDTQTGTARYHVGSGITWDSSSDAEYSECLEKARVLTEAPLSAPLLETMLYDGRYVDAGEHLDRMARSANHLGYAFCRDTVSACLINHVPNALPARVRLMVDPQGVPAIESAPLNPMPATLRIGLARKPVSSQWLSLFHKTTDRRVYDEARRPEHDDTVLWNERGEITESTIANIVVQLDGQCYTPPVDCGLLPGIARANALRDGHVAECILRKADLQRAEAIWIVNSVRGWIPASFTPHRD